MHRSVTRCDDSMKMDTCPNLQSNPTIEQIVDYYLQARRNEIKTTTWRTYCAQAVPYIVGPLLLGSRRDRYLFTRKGVTSEGAQFLEMLGRLTLDELTTAKIRHWHRTLCVQVDNYTAKVAKKHLRSALALAAEDFDFRVPLMPTNRGRGATKPKKAILTPAQIGCLLRGALADDARGIYYAFAFLTGVRPSEQLGLLWDDVDFIAGVIRIRRVQEIDGSISDLTKTVASARDVPMSPLLKEMLLKWQRLCPIEHCFPKRVFPALGSQSHAKHKKRGCPLSYVNFRSNYWRPAFDTLGLPYVTPHSARHAFISTLQASGIEIGLVAKLAGHANPSITLSHYTQAVRGGGAAVQALEQAYIRSSTLACCK